MCFLGCEPPLDEVLEEPIVRALMARDAVAEDELRRLIATVRRARSGDAAAERSKVDLTLDDAEQIRL